MKIIYNTLMALAISTILVSCGGGSDSDPGGTPPPPTTPVAAPDATNLVFPENNTECNEGVVVSDTQSRVTFRWEASMNTDSYEVNLRNLNTNNSSQATFNTNEGDITIDRGTPYEWFVVSRAAGTTETATSATERFYNQGPGVENYAPFPAEVVAPQRGANLDSTDSVTLEWNASDVDNDINGFTILFGTEEVPTMTLGTTTDMTLDAAVSSGTTYYWRVISEDSAGNTSQSEIFQFRVN